MHKFLITKRSGNPITGPILVTTSPRASCPDTCAFKGTTCYAERGFLGGFIWTGLDRTPPYRSFANGIRVYTFDQLLDEVRELPHGALWRHNQAGDLIPNARGEICTASLRALADANTGKRGFTYTHYDPYVRNNYHAILEANIAGFTVTLSANSLEHADYLADLGIASVSVVLPRGTTGDVTTPAGRNIFLCPALTTKGTTCKTCGICARQHQAILGLPEV